MSRTFLCFLLTFWGFGFSLLCCINPTLCLGVETKYKTHVKRLKTTKVKSIKHSLSAKSYKSKKYLPNKFNTHPSYFKSQESGFASFYSDSLTNKRTSSGLPYIPTAYTAASLELPLMSVVKVTNLQNKKSVKVLITDRGPHSPNLKIDLSRKAAEKLGMVRQGSARVMIEYDSKGTRSLTKNKQYYANFGLKSYIS